MSNSYLDALREHRAGNIELAEKLYHDYLEENPRSDEVLHLLGILLAQRNDFFNALHYIDSALEVNPTSASLHNSKGNVLINLGRYSDAVSHYQKSLQIEPDSASVHNNLGNAYYHLEAVDEARRHYCEAIRLRPQYIEAHYNLSLALIKQNLSAEAIKNLEVVLQLQPEHGQAHSNLAYLLQLQGDFDQAMHHYQKSLETSEDSILSHHNLGVILTNKGKHDEAVSHFKRVLDLQPQHTEALHNLGSILLLQKKLQEALPCFLLLSRQSDNFDACYNLGVIYSELGILEEAIVYFNRALKLLPNDFATHANLGAIYLQRREFDLAERHYLKASHLHPDNEMIGYILAAIQQKHASSKAPAAYVKDLFNQYAPYFDKHLDVLGYKVPQLLFEAVKSVIGDLPVPLTVLDLGCGTGMSGAKFSTIANRLIGVDISEKMLEIARKKGVYTDLKLESIEEALTKLSHVDIIIAADTLVYFGDLGDIFAKCIKVLNRGGIFAFTIELTEVYPYVLQRSARFAHSNRYIKELALQNDFVVLQSDKVVLRKQDSFSIEGGLFVFKRIHQ